MSTTDEKEMEDRVKNEGDMEVRDATMAKAQVLARTADKAAAITGYETAEALPKTTSGQKLDCRFHLMRVGMFWGDIPMVESHVTVCREVVDKGGDWERRNRLKVYEATYLLSIRNFKQAAHRMQCDEDAAREDLDVEVAAGAAGRSRSCARCPAPGDNLRTGPLT